VGLPLGTGSPGRRVPLASFSHQRVGSSILASLSEAGGNDLQKVASKPLPPRLQLSAGRHMKRAYGTHYCTGCANVLSVASACKWLFMLNIASFAALSLAPNPSTRSELQRIASCEGKRPCAGVMGDSSGLVLGPG
jgi:hypothetical protein